MPTKRQIAKAIRDRLSDVADRGRVLGRALKVRADMAAARRRLRASYSELGEEAYSRLQSGALAADDSMTTLVDRIDGIKAEVRIKEAELKRIMQAAIGGNGGRDAAE